MEQRMPMASCPTLKRSQDAYVRENNIYLDTFIFRILFEIIPRGDTTLTLNIDPTSKSSIKQLLYEHGTVIGQGEYSLMVSLKESLEELVRNDSLRARIREYEEFKGKLQNNPQYARLRFIATVMRDEIHGGAILGGYPACNLCDPDIPFHLDQPANVTCLCSSCGFVTCIP